MDETHLGPHVKLEAACAGKPLSASNQPNHVDEVPLAASRARLDVTEEGAGADALLHLAVPVMMAKAHGQSDLKHQMELAYQRLMAFQRNRGFSEFPNGAVSEWMTYMGIKTLTEARQFINIDDTLLTNMVNSVVQSNPSDPSLEVAILLYRQTVPHGSSMIYSLDRALNRTRDMLDKNRYSQAQLDDPLTASKLAYTAAMFGRDPSHFTTAVLQKAVTDQTTGEVHWETPRFDTLKYYGDWKSQRVPRADDVTIASYMLLTLLKTGQNSQVDGIAKWLLRHRDIRGRFRSAYDTLVATEALSAYDANLRAKGDGSVTLTSTSGRGYTNAQNARDVLSASGPYDVSVAGQGTVYAQTEVTYYMKDDLGDPAFEVVPVVLDETLQHFKLMVCSRWLLSNNSGQVVQDVDVPSGFRAETTDLKNQQNVEGFVRRNDTRITVYFKQHARRDTRACVRCSTDASVHRPQENRCQRPLQVVMCCSCGFTCRGRIRKTCPVHLNSIYLMDMDSCPSCNSERIREFKAVTKS
nr:hypothetical protein BaRGS_025072 [Batillaria attramentaria]